MSEINLASIRHNRFANAAFGLVGVIPNPFAVGALAVPVTLVAADRAGLVQRAYSISAESVVPRIDTQDFDNDGKIDTVRFSFLFTGVDRNSNNKPLQLDDATFTAAVSDGSLTQNARMTDLLYAIANGRPDGWGLNPDTSVVDENGLYTGEAFSNVFLVDQNTGNTITANLAATGPITAPFNFPFTKTFVPNPNAVTPPNPGGGGSQDIPPKTDPNPTPPVPPQCDLDITSTLKAPATSKVAKINTLVVGAALGSGSDARIDGKGLGNSEIKTVRNKLSGIEVTVRGRVEFVGKLPKGVVGLKNGKLVKKGQQPDRLLFDIPESGLGAGESVATKIKYRSAKRGKLSFVGRLNLPSEMVDFIDPACTFDASKLPPATQAQTQIR